MISSKTSTTCRSKSSACLENKFAAFIKFLPHRVLNVGSCNLWGRIATYIYEDSNCCYGVIPTPTAGVTISGDGSWLLLKQQQRLKQRPFSGVVMRREAARLFLGAYSRMVLRSRYF